MNPVMLIPILALIFNTWLGFTLSDDQLEGIAVIILSAVTAIGFKMGWKKANHNDQPPVN